MATSRFRSAAGFSLIELMLVVGMIGVLSAIAIMQVGSMQPSLKGDGAMRVMMAQLNMARETAVTRRRQVVVDFVGTNMLRVTIAGESTTIGFEGGMQFGLSPGMGDTPDGYGRVSATTFGGVTKAQVRFNSEGTLIDEASSPINGTVFLAIPGEPLSARAITVLGTTGRVRGYRWDGRAWKRV